MRNPCESHLKQSKPSKITRFWTALDHVRPRGDEAAAIRVHALYHGIEVQQWPPEMRLVQAVAELCDGQEAVAIGVERLEDLAEVRNLRLVPGRLKSLWIQLSLDVNGRGCGRHASIAILNIVRIMVIIIITIITITYF